MQVDKNTIFQMRFPQKLWYLLNLRTDVILWGSTGRTILLNYRILENYLQCDHSIFKTTNISSFVRQLNLYGFRKVTSHLQDLLCNSKNPFMHEYVHDYFQYGRPELLNKITRKALAMKRSFKSKNIFNNIDQVVNLTPLQKARKALRMALKKAAQDLYIQNSPKHFANYTFSCEDLQDEYCEDEENIDMDWSHLAPIREPPPESIFPDTDNAVYPNDNVDSKEWVNYDQSQELTNFIDESSQHMNDTSSGQYLSMPVLDPEPTNPSCCAELLAEFNIKHNTNASKHGENQNDQISLNCVLPSISTNQVDDVPMADKENEGSDNFNGEWDQMFNDFISNRGPNPECGSDFKELYSQISKTIDLLNS